MINIIYGAKGSGKTKSIIDKANEAGKSAKGNVVFLTDNNKSIDIDGHIRFINVTEYGITCSGCLKGFIKGLIAADLDIEKIFIDGLGRFLGKDIKDMEDLYTAFEQISELYEVDFCCTVSTSEIPKFMKKYI